jgi:opacity protein-like surface antigen
MQRRSLLLLAVSLALIWGDAVSARASQTVWSGLVIANNVAQPDPVPPELDRLEGTLKELFGYNQFKVIGQSRKSLVTGSEDWLAQSKYFSLHVDSKGGTDAGYVLNLKLFQEKNLLLETDAKLSKASPLVIKGPQVGDGQLLLLLVVQ